MVASDSRTSFSGSSLTRQPLTHRNPFAHQGNNSTVHGRFERFAADGVLQEIWACLVANAIEWARVSLAACPKRMSLCSCSARASGSTSACDALVARLLRLLTFGTRAHTRSEKLKGRADLLDAVNPTPT